VCIHSRLLSSSKFLFYPSELYLAMQHRKVSDPTHLPLLHHSHNTRPSGLCASADSTLLTYIAGGLFESRNKCLDRRKHGENKRIYHIYIYIYIYMCVCVCIQKSVHIQRHIKTSSVCSNNYSTPF